MKAAHCYVVFVACISVFGCDKPRPTGTQNQTTEAAPSRPQGSDKPFPRPTSRTAATLEGQRKLEQPTDVAVATDGPRRDSEDEIKKPAYSAVVALSGELFTFPPFHYRRGTLKANDIRFTGMASRLVAGFVQLSDDASEGDAAKQE